MHCVITHDLLIKGIKQNTFYQPLIIEKQKAFLIKKRAISESMSITIYL